MAIIKDLFSEEKPKKQSNIILDLFDEEKPQQKSAVIPDLFDMRKEEDKLEDTKNQIEQDQINKTKQIADIQQQEEAKKRDPRNWSSEQTKKIFKENPPKNIEEAVQAKTIIKEKENTEKALVDKNLGLDKKEPTISEQIIESDQKDDMKEGVKTAQAVIKLGMKGLGPVGKYASENPEQALKTAEAVGKVARWPFWRAVEQPLSTIVTDIQQSSGAYGKGFDISSTIKRALQSYIPFHRIPDKEQKFYHDIGNNYWASVLETEAPEWYKALWGYGLGVCAEIPLIPPAMKATEYALTRPATDAEMNALQKVFRPLKSMIEKGKLDPSQLSKEGNIIKLSDESEFILDKNASMIIRGDKIRIPRWYKLKNNIVPVEPVPGETTPIPVGIQPIEGSTTIADVIGSKEKIVTPIKKAEKLIEPVVGNIIVEKGSPVIHPEYGEGTVKQVGEGKQKGQLAVKFEKASYMVPIEDVKVLPKPVKEVKEPETIKEKGEKVKKFSGEHITLQGEEAIASENLAKNMIRPYVLRGETIEQLKAGHQGQVTDEGWLSIGGYAGEDKRVGTDKIVVHKLGNKVVNQVYNLKRLYNDILSEQKTKEPAKVEEEPKTTEPQKVEQQKFADEELGKLAERVKESKDIDEFGEQNKSELENIWLNSEGIRSSEIITELEALEKQLKVAKAKEKPDIEKKIEGLNAEQAVLQNSFVNRIQDFYEKNKAKPKSTKEEKTALIFKVGDTIGYETGKSIGQVIKVDSSQEFPVYEIKTEKGIQTHYGDEGLKKISSAQKTQEKIQNITKGGLKGYAVMKEGKSVSPFFNTEKQAKDWLKKKSTSISDEDKDIVNSMIGEIERAEAGKRYKTESGEYGAVSSSFPEWFRESWKGLTKQRALDIIDKAVIGKPLTEKQKVIFDNLLEGYKDELKIQEERSKLIEEGADESEVSENIRLGEAEGKEIADSSQASGEVEKEGELFPEGASEFNPEELKKKSKGGKTPGSVEEPVEEISKGTPSEPQAPKSKADIIKFLEEKLAVPVRIGKFRQKALGIFKGGYAYNKVYTTPDVIRTTESDMVRTVFHEIGHYLDKIALITKSLKMGSRYMEPYKSELVNLSYKKGSSATTGQIVAEGLADFIRYYTIDPKEAQKVAPKFYEKFEKLMTEEYPEIKEVLLQAGKDYIRWGTQPSQARIKAQISVKEDDIPVNYWEQFKVKMVDDLLPVDNFFRLAEKLGIPLKISEDGYVLARLMKGWEGKALHFLEKGALNNSLDIVGKSLKEVLAPVEKAKALDDFEIYLVSKRSVELAGRKIQSGVSKADAETAIKELDEKYPFFEQASQDIYAYNNNLINYLEEGGMISNEMAMKIKEVNKAYVPFFRVIEEAQAHMGAGGKKLANVSNPIKKIKGSTRQIISPLESTIKNTYAIINSVERNTIAQSFAKVASQNSDLGKLFEHIPVPMARVAQVNVREIIDKAFGISRMGGSVMGESGSEIDELLSQAGIDEEDVYNVFRPSLFVPKDNVVTVVQAGKKIFYQVDTDLYRAIMALDKESSNAIMKILAVPASWLRAGATLAPEFIARNPIRDQWSAMIFSKHGYIPMVDLVKGLFHAIGKTDLYYEWAKSGGLHATLVSVDRKGMRNTLETLNKREMPKSPIDILRKLSSLMEEGTRLGEFEKGIHIARKSGLKGKEALLKAGYESREVTLDFNRAGTVGRAINMMVAFWNANVQELSKIHRTFKDPKTRGPAFWKAFLGITVPSILLYLAQKDDPRYQEVPRWQKTAFWIIVTPKHIYRIPKPFALGIAFGTIPEVTLEYIRKRDPKAIEDYAGQIIRQVSPGVLPSVLIPFIEHWANKSFFRGNPIIPESKKYLDPKLQYTDYTSEILKKIGEGTNISPALMENYLRGWFASLAILGLDVADMLIGEEKGIKPEPTDADKPLIKAFSVREPEGYASQSVQDFYDIKNKIDSIKSTVKELREQGKEEEAGKLVLSSRNILKDEAYRNTVKSAYRNIRKIRDYQEKIKMRRLDPVFKRNLLDSLNKDITKQAQRVVNYE